MIDLTKLAPIDALIKLGDPLPLLSEYVKSAN